jgi:hypothetical protein
MILSTGSLFGWRTIGFTLLGVIGAGVGIYFAFFSKAGQPYSFQETLPKMVSSFGGQARVVQIVAGSDSVLYEVIGADGLVHRRDYELQTSETPGGGTGYNRHESNSQRRPTAAERRAAVVTLGSLSPGIVDSLFGRVGFPHDGSSASLTGRTWLLQSGARPFDKYAALFDVRRLRQTSSKATVFGAQSSAPSPAPTTTAQTSTTIKITASGAKANRLLTCVQHAHGDVTKMQACAARFAP